MVKKWLLKYKTIIFVVIYFILFYQFMNYVMIPANVPTSSMSPTIQPGDRIIIYGLAYAGEKAPQRGDIISFISDEFGCDMVKRVIGLEGDIITFQDGKVYINGVLYDESVYIEENVETICERTFTVPGNSYFLLGDNREDSIDSRFWKNPYIEEDRINGKVICIY